jgi:hypothetical protein
MQMRSLANAEGRRKPAYSKEEHLVHKMDKIYKTKDVAEQVKQEMKAGSSRKPRTETRAQHYGICGETGHNARTCQKGEDVSEEEYSD